MHMGVVNNIVKSYALASAPLVKDSGVCIIILVNAFLNPNLMTDLG